MTRNITHKALLSLLLLMASMLAVCQPTDIFVLTPDQTKQGSKLYDAYVDARIKREKAEFQEKAAQDAFNQWVLKTSDAFGVRPGYDLSISPDFKLGKPVHSYSTYAYDDDHSLMISSGWCLNQNSVYISCEPRYQTIH